MEGRPSYASSGEYLDRVRELLGPLREAGDRLVEVLWQALERDATVFVIGNGGSAANASHFAQDLAKDTLPAIDAGRRFRALALTDSVSFITALANDVGYEEVFAQQLRHLARPGDVLLALSGSGRSQNVLRAVEHASAGGMSTFALTGFDGGPLLVAVDDAVHVPVADMGMVEGLHAVVFHLVVSRLRDRLRDASRPGAGRRPTLSPASRRRV